MMKTRVPPASKFKSYNPRVTSMLQQWMTARLFGIRKAITINDKGELNFSHLGIEYSYQLYEPEKLFAYKKSRVIVCFFKHKPDPAFVFNEESKEFICEVNLRPVWTKDKPEILHKHVGALNKIHAYIKRERNHDRITADSGNSTLVQSRLDSLGKRLNKKLARTIISDLNNNENKFQQH